MEFCHIGKVGTLCKIFTVFNRFTWVGCWALSSLVLRCYPELIFNTLSQTSHSVLSLGHLLTQVCSSPLHISLLSHFYDVILNLGAAILVWSCPREIRRILGDFENFRCSWFARLVIRVLGLEDAGFLGGLPFACLVDGRNSEVVVRTFYQVIEADLTFVMWILVDFDPSGAEMMDQAHLRKIEAWNIYSLSNFNTVSPVQFNPKYVESAIFSGDQEGYRTLALKCANQVPMMHLWIKCNCFHSMHFLKH